MLYSYSKGKNSGIRVQPVTSTIQRQNDVILRQYFGHEFHLLVSINSVLCI